MDTQYDTRIVNSEQNVSSGSIDQQYQALLHSPAIRQLFRNLDNEFYLRFGSDPFSLLLTSPGRLAGRTLMALALSVYSARTELTGTSGSGRVLLIDCTRSFDSVKALGINPASGFSLADAKVESAAEMSVQPTPIPGLDLCQIFSPDDDYKALPHQSLATLKHTTSTQYQRVFIDSEPASSGRDYAVLANIFHNLLVVTRYGQTKKEQLLAQVEHLDQISCNILGTVINRRQFVLPQWLYGNG